MATSASREVLTETFWTAEGAGLWVKRAVLVALGVAALTIAAKIKVPLWPSPVPITHGHLRGADARRRLRAAARARRRSSPTWRSARSASTCSPDSSAEANGVAYMLGGTGGYLVGYVLATLALGYAARRGWDRSVGGMAARDAGRHRADLPAGRRLAAPLVAAGLFDPAKYASAWDQTLAWGLTPFLIGDALKLGAGGADGAGPWKLVGAARA